MQPIVVQPTDALIVVDAQNDFCPPHDGIGGALAVAHGDAVIAPINALAPRFAHVILTQDWHPAGHISFASSHPGHSVFEHIATPNGEQVLWPDHCVQQTAGAALHPALHIPNAELTVRKGKQPHVDSYSAFADNDHSTSTGLAEHLRAAGITRVFVAGLAYDFCVAATALDARNEGFEVLVIEDASRAVNVENSVARANSNFAAKNITRILTSDFAKP
ncbi:MAG: bifunctional nicotinamidase/pyrazinamidase [Acidobacteriaceae bacterium]|nr:bifunctional nicotinamidase/pyrazinamidase [Acidobacteriaceae bacterium]